MSSVEAFGPSSQTLTFNESDELIGGGTQEIRLIYIDQVVSHTWQKLLMQQLLTKKNRTYLKFILTECSHCTWMQIVHPQ